MCPALVNRVSFYSVLRDINREASEAAAVDPRGGEYKDGTVHGRPRMAMGRDGNSGDVVIPPLPPPSGVGRQRIVAEDGRVHVHPDRAEERRSVLVQACLTDDVDQEYAVAPAPMCTALLDEERWLVSAISGRTEEASACRAAGLPPTFYKATGEKVAGGATGAEGARTSHRTQLWKPGRSWWEAKRGKNPYLEPVAHNNRLR